MEGIIVILFELVIIGLATLQLSASAAIMAEDVTKLRNKSIEELTPEERWRLEHIKMHEEHKGHEAMHAEMILILLVTLIVAQVVLVEWKKRHYKSYQMVTLVGMWIIPVGFSLKNQWWRFIFLWLVFSCITSLIVRKAIQKPILGTTPRCGRKEEVIPKVIFFIRRGWEDFAAEAGLQFNKPSQTRTRDHARRKENMCNAAHEVTQEITVL